MSRASPKFSATTLSIPESPADNFDKIVEWSRAHYSRPRAEVEAEIRETIEQSEKYKRELSDSGRQAGEGVVFAPVTANDEKPNFTEQKPNFKSGGFGGGFGKPSARPSTPQADFRKQNLSPNAAEGKDRPGLKDLAALVAEKGKDAPEKQVQQSRPPKRNKKSKKRAKGSSNSPVTSTPVSSPVKQDNSQKEGRNMISTPVKPEVVHQEKSVIKIQPVRKELPLDKPIKHTEDYARVDNSMDGFLAINHDK